MTTQIDNLVVSFNEVLLHCGNLFDELYSSKSSNLVLPKNNGASSNLDSAIKTFDRNLDSILMQLKDISLFDSELKRRAIEREEKSRIPDPQELAQQQQQQQQQAQQQPGQQVQTEDNFNIPISDFSNGDAILQDLNEFLSTVPDSTDVNMNEDFNENIQQLLMESNDYADRNGLPNDNSNNSENQDFINDDIFNEIDSMLNI